MFLCLLLLSIFSFSNFVDIDASGEETIYLSATEYDYPPFSVITDGEANGFSVQLLKAVAEEMGINIVFKVDQWSIIKEELKNGELDVLPLVGYSEERDVFFDFTVPYIVMRGNIFVRIGDTSIKSEDDLFGKEILVLDGDNSEEFAIDLGLDEELTTVATYTDAFRLLSEGSFDAVLAQGLVGEKIISDEGFNNLGAVYLYDDDGVTRSKLNLTGYEQKFCFAVIEGDTELLSILNEGLAIVSTNGTYDELYQEWFPFLIDNSPSTWDILRIVLMITIPVIVVLFVFSYVSVRRSVKRKTAHIKKISRRNQIIFDAFRKDFKDSTQRFEFVLEELLELTDSKFGFIFSKDKEKNIKIKSSISTVSNLQCNHNSLKNMILQSDEINKIFLDEYPVIVNDYLFLNEGREATVICGSTVERFLAVAIKNSENETNVVVMLNKTHDYSHENITQTSILMTGFWSILERGEQVEKIEYLSFHDSLTGLYNRRFFEEEMRRLDNPRNYPITIAMGDVNGLKLVNDAFGHTLGDELLKSVATLLQKNCRSNDIVSRWGGDEFVIILPKTSSKEAEIIFDRIQSEAGKMKYAFGIISIAFGFDSKENKEESLSEIFLNAEEIMYRNKINISDSVRGETINIIVNTLFEKSVATKEHSERVSEISIEIAKKMKLSKSKIADIETIGRIHDIGKIVIDLSILDKPSALTEEERLIIEQHPMSGSRMLNSSHEFSRLALGVLYHHERIDGTGYPNGLIGEDIPLESKIIAIADAYDAMTRSRPYRLEPLTVEEAAKEIMENAGTQFDKKIAKVFVKDVLGIEYISYSK